MKKFIPLFITSLVFIFLSCTVDEECRKNRSVNMEVGLYKLIYSETTALFSKTVLSIDSITLRGIRVDTITEQESLVDSILYNNQKSINKLILPLNNSVNQTKYYVRFNEISDTLTILYKKQDYYLSLECGCIKTFTIDTVLTTNNFIDSIKITNHNVNNINAENLQIYN